MLVDGLVLSYMKGWFTPTTACRFAGGGGMFAIGVHEMWRGRATWFGRIGLGRDDLVDRRLELVAPGTKRRLVAALRWVILALTVAAAIALLVS